MTRERDLVSKEPNLSWVRPLFTALTLGPVVFLVLGPELAIPTTVRAMGALLWILALVPCWVQLYQPRERRTPFPFLQIIGLLYGLYYALPIVLGVYNQGSRIVLDPVANFREPAFLALMGWIFLLVAYYGVGSIFGGRPQPVGYKATLPPIMRYWGFLLLYGGICIDLATRFLRIPQTLRSVLHLSHSLTLFGVGLLVVLAVRHQLSTRSRHLMYIGIIGVAAIQVGTGLISNLAFLGAMVFLAVWAAQGYMGPRWIVAAGLGLVLVVALKTVTTEYRRLAWYGGQTISGVEGGRLMVDLLVDRVESNGAATTLTDGLKLLAARSSAVDLMADVVDRTPDQIPFLNGETYLPLIGMAIPRVLWPDKPSKNMGQMFGHRYGHLDSWDLWTSVNCPFVVEFYMNFGAWGVLLGMFVVGLLYRLLRNLINNPGQSPLTSLIALALMVPMLNIESDLSLTFGGLLMNGIALWLVLTLIRSVTGVSESLPSPRHAATANGHPW